MSKEIRVTFTEVSPDMRDFDTSPVLTSLLAEKFSSVKAAKAAMVTDAEVWCSAHNGTKHWKDTKSLDYLHATAPTGRTCTWQYFKV